MSGRNEADQRPSPPSAPKRPEGPPKPGATRDSIPAADLPSSSGTHQVGRIKTVSGTSAALWSKVQIVVKLLADGRRLALFHGLDHPQLSELADETAAACSNIAATFGEVEVRLGQSRVEINGEVAALPRSILGDVNFLGSLLRAVGFTGLLIEGGEHADRIRGFHSALTLLSEVPDSAPSSVRDELLPLSRTSRVRTLSTVRHPGFYVDQGILAHDTYRLAVESLGVLFTASEECPREMAGVVSAAGAMTGLAAKVDLRRIGVFGCRNYPSPGIAHHSTGVAFIAVALGMEMGLNADELRDLAVAALLHDWGMMRLDLEILRWTAPYEERHWKEVRSHPRLGVEPILMNVRGRRPLAWALTGCLFHHAHSGYPVELAHRPVPLIASLIRVADGYEALTSFRPQRSAMLPGDALGVLLRLLPTSPDGHLLRLLARIVGRYPSGTGVELDDGRKGWIVGESSPGGRTGQRLLVRTTTDRLGRPVARRSMVEALPPGSAQEEGPRVVRLVGGEAL